MSTRHENTVAAPADDIDSLLEKTGCRTAFEKVEDCLAANDRAMGKCQTELLAFKSCYDEVGRKRREQQAKK